MALALRVRATSLLGLHRVIIAKPSQLPVVAKANAEGLIEPCAYVVVKPDTEVTVHELQQHVKNRLAPYKYPRWIEFVSELPKTATGKVQRFKLREWSAGH